MAEPYRVTWVQPPGMGFASLLPGSKKKEKRLRKQQLVQDARVQELEEFQAERDEHMEQVRARIEAERRQLLARYGGTVAGIAGILLGLVWLRQRAEARSLHERLAEIEASVAPRQ